MAKRGGTWTAPDWSKRVADAGRSRAEQTRALQKSREDARHDGRFVKRTGVHTPTSTRYATTAAPDNWAQLSAGAATVNALLDSVGDGRDRVLFGWPERPSNGFTVAALALREARATGRLASATLAIWPWRPGLMRAARSVLVHPGDIASTARFAVNDLRAGQAWTADGFAHHELDIVELRLSDLLAGKTPRRVLRGRRQIEILVRNPTLVETTAVFEPSTGTFAANADQVLKRVRKYTLLGDPGASGLPLKAIGDPLVTPFALFGLPPEQASSKLARLLAYQRIAQRGLDAIVVDLTRQSRAELGDQWERSLTVLLQSLDTVAGRRPPVVAICEDPFALRGTTRTLRSHGAQLKPRRQMPIEMGIYLAEPGLLGRASALPDALPAVVFTADIKDAALVGLREKLVGLGRRLRDGGDGGGARGVSKALSFLRRVASLPLGLEEARRTIDVLFDTDDDVDTGVRAMLRPDMALAPLATIGTTSAEGALAREAVDAILERTNAWRNETPVSAKLAELMSRQGWNSAETLIAAPERRIAEALMSSDRGFKWSCGIVEHSELSTTFDKGGLKRVIVTGMTPAAVRALLTSPATPTEVIVLGDASGSALLAGEIGPLARLPGFAPVAARAKAMESALKRGGMDERLDAGESEFKILPIAPNRDIDLTRDNGRYAGDKIVITTSAHRINYRPNSEVLVFTHGELRPFQRVLAQKIERGDEILVLDETIRDRMRDALATSRKSLEQLAIYHANIARMRAALPDSSLATKARQVLRRMQEIDPALPASELSNVTRWLTADQAAPDDDGARQPRAARDWPRFSLFMQANGISDVLAQTYWQFAIVPTRSYRVQEGFQFNQRVVQFVLDPDSSIVAAEANLRLRRLWLSLVDAVDTVDRVQTVSGEKPRE